jgi:hypothetical protein
MQKEISKKTLFLHVIFLFIESTSKCKLAAKLVIMFEKDLIWCEEI